MCSLWSTMPSRSSTRASSGRGFSIEWSRNAGSHWSVTFVMTPRAPRPTRAHANTSASSSREQRSTSPSAVTSSSSVTKVASPPKRLPPPWVAVAIAPEIDWRSMSPRLASARSRVASSPFSCQRGMPPSTVTVRASRSSATTRLSAPRRNMRPSVQAMPVNEWPAPTTLTVCPARFARRTDSTTSSSLVGDSTAAGLHSWLRPQLRQRARSRIGAKPTSLAPAELAEACVVDAEVMCDLVDHGDPDLVCELRFVTGPLAQGPAEDCDPIGHRARVVDRRPVGELHPLVEAQECARPSAELLARRPVLDEHHDVVHVRGEIGRNGVERVADELLETIARHLHRMESSRGNKDP